ncbi:hypothetical protein C5167_014400 [Papaver somniferum]|uniref:Cystinosin homolog n=1 Tax=Papaver somniferum TaxID=3469 RepID=A0A4Y7J7D3_PAPSO|nr:cystinosin homolog isoform X1 [Papaver somniferum]XP_026456711.1 cystinosin homolog isoform X1 [Papaver somniferum]XP_026456712.1 cystinosin homolog isoform X1 [Papaver somniferum]RZC55545.1 hypothetical protein C5167_014400 [Papaver somniferum]
MDAWNSTPLEIAYIVFGWISFASWGFSFYPQIILNFRTKSVVGLNFDFLVLNLTKHSSYLIYNATLYFSPVVQRQYHEKYGFDQMIPVAANDVAFSTHSVMLTAVAFYQVFIYERGTQKVARSSIAITAAVWVSAAVCSFVAWPNQSWLWLISVFNAIQVTMTVIKYIPQVLLNCKRKSTEGWSTGYVFLDLLGGVTSYTQMVMQSIDQGSLVNFYGNLGKCLLSLVSIFYDLIFLFQRYVLYHYKKDEISSNSEMVHDESAAPLIKSSYHSQAENV